MKTLIRKICNSRCLMPKMVTSESMKRYCTEMEKTEPTEMEPDKKNNFRVLKLFPPSKEQGLSRKSETYEPLKDIKYSEDTDWSDVWVGPRTFDPYMVPLPIRQGYVEKGVPCSKYANLELMKIPNFLHLTPVAVKKHCDAIKKFCTEWPKGLKEEKEMDTHFPVNVITSDYCFSSESIREPMSRIVTIKVKLKRLKLDKHAKDKFLRLVGERYDKDTDDVTIVTKSCPLKKQNYDYAMYILTALYYESWKIEDWEEMKTDEDMEEYIFDQRKAVVNMKNYFEYNNREVGDISQIGQIVEEIVNNGENATVMQNFKTEMLKLLELPPYGQ